MITHGGPVLAEKLARIITDSSPSKQRRFLISRAPENRTYKARLTPGVNLPILPAVRAYTAQDHQVQLSA